MKKKPLYNMLTIFKPMDEIFPIKLFNPKNIFQKERETKLRNAIYRTTAIFQNLTNPG